MKRLFIAALILFLLFVGVKRMKNFFVKLYNNRVVQAPARY